MAKTKIGVNSMRSRVAFDLKELRKAYYNNEYVRFAEIYQRTVGYFFLDLMSYDARSRAMSMAYRRGLMVR